MVIDMKDMKDEFSKKITRQMKMKKEVILIQQYHMHKCISDKSITCARWLTDYPCSETAKH